MRVYGYRRRLGVWRYRAECRCGWAYDAPAECLRRGVCHIIAKHQEGNCRPRKEQP